MSLFMCPHVFLHVLYANELKGLENGFFYGESRNQREIVILVSSVMNNGQ